MQRLKDYLLLARFYRLALAQRHFALYALDAVKRNYWEAKYNDKVAFYQRVAPKWWPRLKQLPADSGYFFA